MGQAHSKAALRVGQRVQELRHQVGLSRRLLAECAELDTTHLQRIERGEANPTLVTLLQIAIALEVDVMTLSAGVTSADMPHGRLPYGHSERHRYRRGLPWEPTVFLGDKDQTS